MARITANFKSLREVNNKMNLINVIIYPLALVGLYLTIKEFIIPIVDGILYATGYTIFSLIQTNWKSVPPKPFRFIKIVLWHWWFCEIIERITAFGKTENITRGDIKWTPYFKYENLKKLKELTKKGELNE